MHWKDYGAACSGRHSHSLTCLAASAFIAAVVVGSLCSMSCARTEAGLQREQVVYVGSSNALESVKQIVPYVPPPANGVLEGVLAVGGALLAVWATHLQRSLKDLRNGNGVKPQAPGPPAAPGV